MIYILFPECNILIHVLWGVKQQNTVFAVGKSIFIVREICTGGRTPPLPDQEQLEKVLSD